MVSGGNATVFVSNMDASIRFYADVLGMKLTNRFGNDWATLKAGDTLTIGLHPVSPNYPPPGTKGAIALGLEIDTTIEVAIARLLDKGIAIKGTVTRSDPGNFASLEDPDGNQIYLWGVNRTIVPEPELAHAAAH
jgi:catechol 2,3-dioxygenase-like lactoylglutathione lyase family enzyme